MESLEIFFYGAQKRGFKKLCEQFPLSILQLMAYAAREKKRFLDRCKKRYILRDLDVHVYFNKKLHTRAAY